MTEAPDRQDGGEDHGWWVAALACIGGAALTAAALYGLFVLVAVALYRGTGSSGCGVCNHLPAWPIGAHCDLVSWAIFKWHRLWWGSRPWHRRAVRAYRRRLGRAS